MTEDRFIEICEVSWKVTKWFLLQVVLLFAFPYIWEDYSTSITLVLIFIYTLLYICYNRYTPKRYKVKLLFTPYLLYLVSVMILRFIIGNNASYAWHIPLWTSILLPLHGAISFITIRLLKIYSRKNKVCTIKKYSTIILLSLFSIFIVKKSWVAWECRNHESTTDGEKKDILMRRDYLNDKLIASPKQVLNSLPSSIGQQFQGEWALYSCSMLSAALVNIAITYPETKKENVHNVDSLIQIVLSPELRLYDRIRWKEDPLETLLGNKSHISYLSHLAWMISGYKRLTNNNKYDEIYSSVCETMNRRIVNSKILNLPTYPNEVIYVPDMLVAIVALSEYSKMNNGTYSTTVKKWIKRARSEWIDKKSGLLSSFLSESDGRMIKDAPVKGSYSALNCYYLTLIDENFAREQYKNLKSYFWKESFISGFREYNDEICVFGLDMDAGPIIFDLSPTGTAFAIGSATYFNDSIVRKALLHTAEEAGSSITFNNKRHYLLANVALVGEAITLAMRTNVNKKNIK